MHVWSIFFFKFSNKSNSRSNEIHLYLSSSYFFSRQDWWWWEANRLILNGFWTVTKINHIQNGLLNRKKRTFRFVSGKVWFFYAIFTYLCHFRCCIFLFISIASSVQMEWTFFFFFWMKAGYECFLESLHNNHNDFGHIFIFLVFLKPEKNDYDDDDNNNGNESESIWLLNMKQWFFFW